MTDRPTVSVLLTTFRRTGALTRCLDSLRAQTWPPTQVLVVMRDTDTPTHELVAGYRAAHPDFPLATASAHEPGVVAANNVGLPLLTGDVVAFLDDDSTAPPHWLERLVRHYTDPTVGAVGGRIENYENGRLTCADRALSGKSMRIDRQGRIHPGQRYAFSGVRTVDHLAGGNMSFRRHLLTACDANLRGHGFRYETDLCLTAQAAGYRILLDGDAWNTHTPEPRHGLPNRDDGTGRWHDQAYNEAYVVAKHGRTNLLFLLATLFWRFPLAVLRAARHAEPSRLSAIVGTLRGLAQGLTVGRTVRKRQLEEIRHGW